MKQLPLFDFLEALAANNNRVWFAEHRAEYDILRTDWLEKLQRVINAMAVEEKSLRHVNAADCTYRIYRDTRFSKDKAPFKTHFGALISATGRHSERACWYLHLGIDECFIWGGMWSKSGKDIRKVRKAIVDNIEEFRSIIENKEMLAEFPQWYGRVLKTAPQGYDRNHPDIDLLRLTEYSRWCALEREFFDTPNWPEQVANKALLLKPLNDFINYSLDE